MSELNVDGNFIGVRFVSGVNKYDFWLNDKIIYLHQFDYEALIEMLLEYSDKDKCSFYSNIFSNFTKDEISRLVTDNDKIYDIIQEITDEKADNKVDDMYPEDYFSGKDEEEKKKNFFAYIRENYRIEEVFDTADLSGSEIRDLVDESNVDLEDIFSNSELNDWALNNGYSYG